MGKVAVFGIDGAELSLIEKWQDELPNFKKLLDGGVYGKLETTLPPLTSPAWPCMFTGRNPAKLGLYGFIKNLAREEGRFELNTSNDYNEIAIWSILNRHGEKVGLLNVPLTFPPHSIDSFMVCGIGAPVTAKSQYTYPPELKNILDEVVGGYEITPIILLDIPGNIPKQVAAFEKVLEKREKAAAHLMSHFPWDLFICVFYVIDSVQHRFWHYMEKKHIKRGDERYANLIKYFYIKVDAAIGRLISKMPDDVNILVVSDHGFGPCHGRFAVNRWLEHKNLLRFKSTQYQDRLNLTILKIRNFLLSRLNPNTTARIAKFLPQWICTRLTVREATRRRMEETYRNIDWTHTKAYGIGEIGQIYINLKGREPYGIVEPGTEYENLRNEIIRELKQTVNPNTGEKLEIRIFKKEDIYKGQYFNAAPDVAFYIDHYPQAVSVTTKNIWHKSELTGHHSREGIFFAYGPDINKSRGKLNNLKIFDITPTILHIFGLPIPKDIDGRVLTEIFDEKSKPAKRKVVYQEFGETDKIRNRIKRLKLLKKSK